VLLRSRRVAYPRSRARSRERLVAALSSGFGLLALLLVCVGLYGIMSQTVSQRTSELGLRIVLGATPGSVRWSVLREAFIVVLAGLALGVPAALGTARLLTNLLYDLSPMDPLTLVATTGAMVVIVLVAAYLPARRASSVDPIEALRSE
jgi:ABC-type antimicrobial peptide transport system permease subunit